LRQCSFDYSADLQSLNLPDGTLSLPGNICLGAVALVLGASIGCFKPFFKVDDMRGFQFFYAGMVLMVLSASALAQVSDCDRLAAAPLDPQKQAPGVAYNRLNASLAVPACKKATEESPQLARVWFQYGRALEKANQLPDAIAAYQEAARLKSGAALNNIGELYRDGKGFQKDLKKAEQYFNQAAALNSPEGESNLMALQAQLEKLVRVAMPKELVGSWSRKGSVCPKKSVRASYTNGYGMVFTSSELRKERISDYKIGPDICIPQQVRGQFPIYTIAFNCKPGDDGPYTTVETLTVTGNQLTIDLNGITAWTRCPD
jgi:tetratricopeptide (TPR) repeat protein